MKVVAAAVIIEDGLFPEIIAIHLVLLEATR